MEQPDDDADGAIVGRGRSARLLRQGSAILSGGAAIIPPIPEAADETAPVTEEAGERRPILRRQATRRVQTQEAVMARMAQEALSRWWPLFILLWLMLMVCYAYYFYAIVVHVMAVLNHWTKPCDQLLHYYFIAMIGIAVFNGKVTQPICLSYGPKGLAASVAIGAVSGWCVIAWGLWMVSECKTCQKTNAELYTTARDLIYCQIFFSIMVSCLLAFGSVAAVRFMALAERRSHPGCAAALAKMARVKPDDDELVDTEDGKVMDCPICQDSMKSKGMEVLRTPCGHHFHVSCLEKWTKAHLDCPMCREQLGEPEDENV